MGKIILTPIQKPAEKKPDAGIIRLVKASDAQVDESPPKSVHDFLLEKTREDNCNLFAIIDSARNEDVFRYLVTGNVQYKSLFEGTMDVQSYGVSGFLVECKQGSPLFDWMTREAWGDSCCIFFTSEASFDELFSHFQKFNRVYLEDDQVVLFRYYDPRVLRVYLPTCNRAEVELFFGEVISFYAELEDKQHMNSFRKNDAPKDKPLQVISYPVFK